MGSARSRWICWVALLSYCLWWGKQVAVHAGSRIYNTTATRSPTKLNVHLIPHSHCDAGWLQTFTQYYRGWAVKYKDDKGSGTVVADGVGKILDTVVASLLLNPDRTFVVADMAYFVKWWQEQAPSLQSKVKQLVARGQLEFVNGGLVQHDEATSHYSGIIDQMGMGMRFLYEELDVEPRVAWMLDDFGHSRAEPLLRTMGGFEALFFARAAKEDLMQRKQQHQMELVWRGSSAYGAESDLFVSQSPSGTYTTPNEAWEKTRPDTGVLIPDTLLLLDDGSPASIGRLKHPNVLTTLNDFYAKAANWQTAIPSGQNDVMMLFGGDMAFTDAALWFAFMDKLIHYVNREGTMNAFYSTPEKFLQAKRAAAGSSSSSSSSHDSSSSKSSSAAANDDHKSSSSGSSSNKTVWPLKSDDFFPYKCDKDLYWTGFYSSRPGLKGMIRQASALLQATRQLEVIAGLPPSSQVIATAKGTDPLNPKPSGPAARAAAAAAATAALAAEREYDAASTAAVAAYQEASAQARKENGGKPGAPVKVPAAVQDRVAAAAEAVTRTAAARAAAAMSAAEELEGQLVPEGPDTAVLEFAVALAHHHDAITGTQKLHVRDDYIHWLHVGLLKAVPKMLLGLQQLVFGPTASPSSNPAAPGARATATGSIEQPSGPDPDPAAATRRAAGRKDKWGTDQQQVPGKQGRVLLQSESPQPPLGSNDSHNGSISQALLSDVISIGPLANQAAPVGDPSQTLAHSLTEAAAAAPQDAESSSKPTSTAAAAASADGPVLSYCLLLNASLCSSSVEWSRPGGPGGFLLVVYNPLSWPTRQGLRIPVVAGRSYTVTGPDSAAVPSQLLPLPPRADITWRVSNLSHLASSHSNTQQLAFQADVPALGHAVYTITTATVASATASASQDTNNDNTAAAAAAAAAKSGVTGEAAPSNNPHSGSAASASSSHRQLAPQDELSLTNGALKVDLVHAFAGIKGVTVLSTGRQYRYSHSLVQYDVQGLFHNPGAYVFATQKQSQSKLPAPSVDLYEGPVVSEVRQSWGSLGAVVTRLWRGSEVLEVEWNVGPPPAGQEGGPTNWELFLRHESDIASGGVWYTDANGLEWQQRSLGFRPSFNTKGNDIPENLYPMTAGAVLREVESGGGGPSRQLFVSTDRAQGVVSLEAGQLDVLLHRVSAQDDGKGMDERLDDHSVVIGRHYVWFTDSTWRSQQQQQQHSSGNMPLHARHHQHMLANPLQLAFSPLPAPGTLYRETSTLLAPPGQSASSTGSTTPQGQTFTAARSSRTTLSVDVAGLAAAQLASNSSSSNPARSISSRSLSSIGSSSSSIGSSSSSWPSLPGNVHVLSLQWRSCETILLRLSHIFQSDEVTDDALAQEASLGSLWHLFNTGNTVQLPPTAAAGPGGAQKAAAAAMTPASTLAAAQLFVPPGFKVTGIREATLFGARPLQQDDVEPHKPWPLGDRITHWQPPLWPPPRDDSSHQTPAGGASKGYSFLTNRIVGPVGRDVSVSLRPMQIRSFLLTVQRSSSSSSSSGGGGGYSLLGQPCQSDNTRNSHSSQEAAQAQQGTADMAAATTAAAKQEPSVATGTTTASASAHATSRSSSLQRLDEPLPPPKMTFSVFVTGWRLMVCLLAAMAASMVMRAWKKWTMQHQGGRMPVRKWLANGRTRRW